MSSFLFFQYLQLWSEDQGFFKVNVALSGDFVVIVRFSGADRGAETGPEGVLFRYCNHTCFLPEGDQVVLVKSQVWCPFLGEQTNTCLVERGEAGMGLGVQAVVSSLNGA